MSLRTSPLAALTLLAVVAANASTADPTPPDHTRTSPESLGIKPVSPEKDPKTGFVVGGRNPTALIGRLTEIARRPIADLEKDMRPGRLSDMGFLGKDERLRDVLAEDNRFVEKLGRSHQELARHLHLLGALAVKHGSDRPAEIAYHGRKFRIRATCYRGFQDSPFRDGTKANCDATVENLGNGKKLAFSLLVPHMIERYGFYEGKGTPYRVEPKTVVEVLDFLEARKGS